MTRLIAVVAVILVVVGGAMMYFSSRAEDMAAFCSSIKPGESVTAVRAKAAASVGLVATRDTMLNGVTTFTVSGTGSVGGLRCLVEHSGDKVTKVTQAGVF